MAIGAIEIFLQTPQGQRAMMEGLAEREQNKLKNSGWNVPQNGLFFRPGR